MDRETSMVSVIMPAYNIEKFIAQAIELSVVVIMHNMCKR